jgi:hypothetical protein
MPEEPVYNQRDPAWSGTRLGTCDGTTIGRQGCYVAAFAQVATHYGHVVDPQQLNDQFTNDHVFIQGCLLPDDGICKIFSDVQLIDVYHCKDIPCDLTKLQMADDEEVCLEISWPQGGFQTHFMRLYQAGLDRASIIVDDPWFGTRGPIGVHYPPDPATLIIKVIKFRLPGWIPPWKQSSFPGKPAPAGAVIRQYPGTDAPAVRVAAPAERLTFDAFCHYGPGIPDFRTGKPDDRWFRPAGTTQAVASAAIDGNPPDSLVAIPQWRPAAPLAAGPDPVPFTGDPKALEGRFVWEWRDHADYALLREFGFSGVLIRATNGAGEGPARDFETGWKTAAATARANGMKAVAWTFWYGASDGVTGDVGAYLLRCAQYTAALGFADTPAWVIDAEDRDLPGLAPALKRLADLTGKAIFLAPPGDPREYGIRWDWQQLDAIVDGYIPQIYTASWQGTPTFDAAFAEWTPAPPLYPASDETDPQRAQAWCAAAAARNVKGTSFWRWGVANDQTLRVHGANPAI